MTKENGRAGSHHQNLISTDVQMRILLKLYDSINLVSRIVNGRETQSITKRRIGRSRSRSKRGKSRSRSRINLSRKKRKSRNNRNSRMRGVRRVG